MLTEAEEVRLVQLIAATAEVVGDEVKPTVCAMMAEDLSVYAMPVLERALAACRRELKGRLTLAAVLERIEDGHPSPNEAWALSLRAADERNTVVWTDEMSRAWGAARPLVEAGDRIGARMAFLEVYGRLVKEAKNERRPARYLPSLGYDPTDRDTALRQAVDKGLLPPKAAEPHLLPGSPVPRSSRLINEMATALALPSPTTDK